ncbi:MAG TPA: guanylate kinase [Gammaproteobacteria bacterium]|jgi:guanylate kinase|nr:guanylate kinase [Gammaproteobacteria bacterium]
MSAPRGRLWVIAAPSGAGKTSLVRALLERDPSLRFSTSFTTRPPRAAEVHGRDYFFVSEAEFLAMVQRQAFLEHARVFDHWYGTGREHVESLLAGGHSVLLEIDWQGARQVRERAPDSRSIFILPPSVAELERRLRGRKTDAEPVIQRRLRDALGDMGHWSEFDYVVVNEDFAAALRELADIVAGRGEGARTSLPAVQTAAAAIVAGR